VRTALRPASLPSALALAAPLVAPWVVSASLSVVVSAASSGCGARTGLGTSDEERDAWIVLDLDAARRDASLDASLDAGRDVGLDAPFDAGRDAPIDACTVQTLALAPVRPEVVFVLDRSTSMGWGLTGPAAPPPSRWTILVDALRAQLPRYDEASDMGALLYPAEGGDRCTVAPDPQLDPGPGNASRLLELVGRSGPGGRTPTFDGLEAARRWFVAHPDVTHTRAVVLATDGAPNCNASLDGRRCPCTGGAGLPVGACRGDDTLCLDDARTVAVIEDLARGGIPTYVIGIDGDPDPALSEVLTRMALAGERPNPLDPSRAFYSVRRPEDLGAAFDRIQASIVSCTLAVLGTLPTDRGIAVTLDGVPLPRDPSRTEGWDFSDELEGTIVLYGDTCARALEDASALALDILCAAP
jgi:hypothetical protein